jgi:hypothetical protein
MLTSAFRAARFTYTNIGMLKPFFINGAEKYTSPSDVEATIEMVRTSIGRWSPEDPLTQLVDEALKKCVFLWDTIQLKKKKHNEKWFADWRSLSLDNEYKSLIEALNVLEHRYTMAVLSKMSVTPMLPK